MMTKSQMMKMEGRRIAKRPKGNGSGKAPTPRAPITGKVGQAAVPKTALKATSATSNMKGTKATARAATDGKAAMQTPRKA